MFIIRHQKSTLQCSNRSNIKTVIISLKLATTIHIYKANGSSLEVNRVFELRPKSKGNKCLQLISCDVVLTNRERAGPYSADRVLGKILPLCYMFHA